MSLKFKSEEKQERKMAQVAFDRIKRMSKPKGVTNDDAAALGRISGALRYAMLAFFVAYILENDDATATEAEEAFSNLVEDIWDEFDN